MARKTSEQKLATNQVYLNQLEDIKVRVPKGYRAEIQEYAKNQGISVNHLIIRAVQADAKANNDKMNVPNGMKEVKKETKE